MPDLTSLRVKVPLADKCVGRQVVGDHVGGIQRVEVQDRHGLVKVHANLGTDHDGALVGLVALHIFQRPQNLITLSGVVGNS